MKTGYLVCDAMTKAPISISPSLSIKEAAKIMNKHEVGSLIIKEGDSLKGIITDQDIVRKIIAKGIDPETAQVHKHMAKELTTISPEKDIFEAINLMSAKNVKQLPVMDGRKMIGLITQKDVLKLEPELFDLIVDKLNIKEEEHKAIMNDGVCEECGKYSEKLLSRKGALICKQCSK
jgi:signal-transduction protein with cAMP-binding, CBS, and nucleotidyltransferase domain